MPTPRELHESSSRNPRRTGRRIGHIPSPMEEFYVSKEISGPRSNTRRTAPASAPTVQAVSNTAPQCKKKHAAATSKIDCLQCTARRAGRIHMTEEYVSQVHEPTTARGAVHEPMEEIQPELPDTRRTTRGTKPVPMEKEELYIPDPHLNAVIPFHMPAEERESYVPDSQLTPRILFHKRIRKSETEDLDTDPTASQTILGTTRRTKRVTRARKGFKIPNSRRTARDAVHVSVQESEAQVPDWRPTAENLGGTHMAGRESQIPDQRLIDTCTDPSPTEGRAQKVGDDVEIWWCSEKTFYRGRLTCNVKDEIYTIMYEDGFLESLDLNQHHWRYATSPFRGVKTHPPPSVPTEEKAEIGQFVEGVLDGDDMDMPPVPTQKSGKKSNKKKNIKTMKRKNLFENKKNKNTKNVATATRTTNATTTATVLAVDGQQWDQGSIELPRTPGCISQSIGKVAELDEDCIILSASKHSVTRASASKPGDSMPSGRASTHDSSEDINTAQRACLKTPTAHDDASPCKKCSSAKAIALRSSKALATAVLELKIAPRKEHVIPGINSTGASAEQKCFCKRAKASKGVQNKPTMQNIYSDRCAHGSGSRIGTVTSAQVDCPIAENGKSPTELPNLVSKRADSNIPACRKNSQSPSENDQDPTTVELDEGHDAQHAHISLLANRRKDKPMVSRRANETLGAEPGPVISLAVSNFSGASNPNTTRNCIVPVPAAKSFKMLTTRNRNKTKGILSRRGDLPQPLKMGGAPSEIAKDTSGDADPSTIRRVRFSATAGAKNRRGSPKWQPAELNAMGPFGSVPNQVKGPESINRTIDNTGDPNNVAIQGQKHVRTNGNDADDGNALEVPERASKRVRTGTEGHQDSRAHENLGIVKDNGENASQQKVSQTDSAIELEPMHRKVESFITEVDGLISLCSSLTKEVESFETSMHFVKLMELLQGRSHSHIVLAEWTKSIHESTQEIALTLEKSVKEVMDGILPQVEAAVRDQQVTEAVEREVDEAPLKQTD